MTQFNINDINACKSAYIAHCQGKKTEGVSDKDIKEIESKYGTQLKDWKVESSKDNNDYQIEDFDDSSRKKAMGNIKKSAKKTTLRVADRLLFGASFLSDCIDGFSEGVKYTRSKPNKDLHKELMQLENSMQNYLSELESEQGIMSEDTGKLNNLSETAEEVTEESSKTIEELQAEYDKKVARQKELATKIESGEELTEQEKAEYEKLGVDIESLGAEIENVKAESNDAVNEVKDETEGVQDDVNTTADKIKTMQKTADYAESFDELTQVACVLETGAQALNAAISTKGAVNAFAFAQSGALLFGSTLWANAFGAMGVAGAAMSGVGVVEQTKMAVDISGEIDVRNQLQEALSQTEVAVQDNANTASDITNAISGDTIAQETPAPSSGTPSDTPASGDVNNLNLEENSNKKGFNKEFRKNK